MFGLGAPELILLLLIAVLLFGSKKLPELGKGLGQSFRAFRRGRAGEDEAASVPLPVTQRDDRSPPR